MTFQAKHEKEEEERKKRIQLYVFVLRSIAYTFNAKQSSDMQKRNLKVTKEGHEKMKSKVDVSVARYPILIARRNLVLWRQFRHPSKYVRSRRQPSFFPLPISSSPT